MRSYASAAATGGTPGTPPLLITNTGFDVNGAIAVPQTEVPQTPPRIRLVDVNADEARSTLLSRAAATSLSRSFEKFAESNNISPASRETLRALGSVIDGLLLTNAKLIPLITEHAGNASNGDIIEFICKLNTALDLFSREFYVDVFQASREISESSNRIFATRADRQRVEAMKAFIDNISKLSLSVAASRESSERGPAWFSGATKYNACILKALHDFLAAAEQQ